MKQGFFKKNKSLRFVICLILFIPLIVAVISALMVDPDTVTVNNLSTVEITPPEGNTYVFDDQKVLDLYSSVSVGAKEIDESFRDFSLEEPYTISFNENNAEPIVYKFYASTNAEDCVYVSMSGKYYLVDKDIAEKIIRRDEFASIDTSGLLPVLTISALEDGITAEPDSFSWTYTALDGTVSTVKDEKKADNPVIKFDNSDEGSIEMSFDRQPDSLTLEICEGDDVKFNDKYENLKDTTHLVYDHDQKLSMKVVAEWYEIEGAQVFGKAEYNLDVLYDIAPEYRLVNLTLPTGEFTVLNMKNFNDGELLSVESDMGLPEKIRAYDYKDIKIALIPLASTLEAGDYNIKLTTELGQTSAVKMNVARREEYDSQTLIIDDDKYPSLNEAFSDEALEEFNALVDKYTLESSSEQLYVGKNFDYPTGATKLASGGARYGMDREVISLNSDGTSYVCFGQDMECIDGQAIKAANNGVVVFAGETKLLGGTVIVDHGYGILTYYGNLSEISANVGDEVEKSKTVLGKAGSTGFACILDGVNAKQQVVCHYAVSLDGGFIAPKSIYNGIYLS